MDSAGTPQMPRSPLLGWCVYTPILISLDPLPALSCLFLGELLSADRSYPTQGTARPSLRGRILDPQPVAATREQKAALLPEGQLCGTADAPESSVDQTKARLYLGPSPCLTWSPFPVVLKLLVCIRITLETGYTTESNPQSF